MFLPHSEPPSDLFVSLPDPITCMFRRVLGPVHVIAHTATAPIGHDALLGCCQASQCDRRPDNELLMARRRDSLTSHYVVFVHDRYQPPVRTGRGGGSDVGGA